MPLLPRLRCEQLRLYAPQLGQAFGPQAQQEVRQTERVRRLLSLLDVRAGQRLAGLVDLWKELFAAGPAAFIDHSKLDVDTTLYDPTKP